MKNVIFLISVAILSTSFSTPHLSINFQQEYVIKKGFTVAFSKEGYDKMMDAVANKDNAYFQKLKENQVILTLPNDVPVYMIERHVFSGYSEVRLKGKDVKLWTVNDSLKKK